MKEFEIIIDTPNNPLVVKSMFDLYYICRMSYEFWIEKSIKDTSDIHALKKEFDALNIPNLSEEEAYIMLDKIDTTKHIKDYTLYELVCIHNACGSLLKILCKRLDTDSDMMNSVAAVDVILAQVCNMYIGIPKNHAIISCIWKMGQHLPSGHEYIDVADEMFKYDYTFGHKTITDIAHDLFDDLIKLYKGGN